MIKFRPKPLTKLILQLRTLQEECLCLRKKYWTFEICFHYWCDYRDRYPESSVSSYSNQREGTKSQLESSNNLILRPRRNFMNFINLHAYMQGILFIFDGDKNLSMIQFRPGGMIVKEERLKTTIRKISLGIRRACKSFPEDMIFWTIFPVAIGLREGGCIQKRKTFFEKSIKSSFSNFNYIVYLSTICFSLYRLATLLYN